MGALVVECYAALVGMAIAAVPCWLVQVWQWCACESTGTVGMRDLQACMSPLQTRTQPTAVCCGSWSTLGGTPAVPGTSHYCSMPAEPCLCSILQLLQVLEEIVHKFDANGNGTIEYNEFIGT